MKVTFDLTPDSVSVLYSVVKEALSIDRKALSDYKSDPSPVTAGLIPILKTEIECLNALSIDLFKALEEKGSDKNGL